MLQSRQISWPAYLVSIAMIAIPLVDALTSLYPWRLGDARWRFGAVGLISNGLLIPVAGILVAYVTATLFDHRLRRRVIGVAGYAMAAICVLSLILFALDALQTRAAVRPEMRINFTVASFTAAAKTLLAAATFLGFGVCAFRDGAPSKKRSEPADVLLSTDLRAQPPSKRQG
jgi:hypothetical protein